MFLSKVTLWIFAFAIMLSAETRVEAATKNVLMMIPDDFMWPEYQIPLERYKKAGFEVKLAGKNTGSVNPDKRNLNDFPGSGPVKVDLTFDQVKVSDFDAITFVAGNGAWHDFFPNETVHTIVKDAFAQNRVVGLLCASTGLLGLVNNFSGNETPIAAGKNAVGYFRVEGIISKLGKVNVVAGGRREAAAVVDGNLVTGRNPESSTIFAEKIVEVLSHKR